MTHPFNDTADVLARFNEAFLRHEPALLDPLIADDCVVEKSNPVPGSTHHVGRAACLAAWKAIAADRSGEFTVDEVTALGEIGLIFWRYRTGPAPEQELRAINVMRVRDGLIAEGRGYVKTRPAVTA